MPNMRGLGELCQRRLIRVIELKHLLHQRVRLVQIAIEELRHAKAARNNNATVARFKKIATCKNNLFGR